MTAMLSSAHDARHAALIGRSMPKAHSSTVLTPFFPSLRFRGHVTGIGMGVLASVVAGVVAGGQSVGGRRG